VVGKNEKEPIRGILPHRQPAGPDLTLRQSSFTLEVSTRGQGLHEVTDPVTGWTAAQGMGEGLLTLFCRHTSASLLIQENAAPEARADLEAYFARIAPEDPGAYAHDDEGPDDMPAHLRAALTAVQLSIPLSGGRLALGTWQGIYLFEHRRRPHRRQIALHLLGE
jgi:secondary thiamine-phosphate synthase enzyme